MNSFHELHGDMEVRRHDEASATHEGCEAKFQQVYKEAAPS